MVVLRSQVPLILDETELLPLRHLVVRVHAFAETASGVPVFEVLDRRFALHVELLFELLSPGQVDVGDVP